MRLSYWAMIAIIAMVAIHALYYYPRLPETLISRVDSAGNPTSHTSKSALFRDYALVIGVTALCFSVLPLFLRRVPSSQWSFPRREHWLAPERREATISWFEEWVCWGGIGFIVFLGCAFHTIFVDNMTPEEPASVTFFWILLGVLPVLLIAWFGKFWLKFR